MSHMVSGVEFFYRMKYLEDKINKIYHLPQQQQQQQLSFNFYNQNFQQQQQQPYNYGYSQYPQQSYPTQYQPYQQQYAAGHTGHSLGVSFVFIYLSILATTVINVL